MKFIDLFAGMGGMRKGFEQACMEQGITTECVFTSEIKPHAIDVLTQNHPNEKINGDITKVSTEDIPDFDVLLGGFPCFSEGTLITTKNGLKNIEDIVKGDMVLTHTNTFKEVVLPMRKHKKGIYNLSVYGLPTTKVTEEHPYYVKEIIGVDSLNNKLYSEPKWVAVKDLDIKKHVVGLSQNNENKNPHNITEEESFLLGLSIYNSDKTLNIEDSKRKEVLENILSECVFSQADSQIPTVLLSLPKELLKSVLNGIRSGYDNEGYTQSSHILLWNIKLLLSFGQAFQKVYNTPIYSSHMPETDIYFTNIIECKKKTESYLPFPELFDFSYSEGMLWQPLEGITYLKDWEGSVYNFEVAEDNSYVANNATVHNCQSFSMSGNRLGFEDTRGTLFFNVAKILKDKQPKGFILENVEGLVSHDKKNPTDSIGNTLKTILKTLEELGYFVSWRVLNAKDFNVAQNRKRIFIVGSKKSQPELDGYTPITSNLSDVLESNIPIEQTPFTDLLQSHFKSEELIGKQISDKRGGNSNIHSWDFSYKGVISEDEKALMNIILQERRKKKWAKEYGISWMDGMPLTKKHINSFYPHDNLEGMLEHLVYLGYLKLEHPKTKIGSKRVPDNTLPLGYNIVAGQLSFPIRKILNPMGIAPTLVATDMDRLYVLDNEKLRPLTYVECLRLCGYPEDYKFNIGIRDCYDLIGNTVAVPVVKFTAQKLLESI